MPVVIRIMFPAPIDYLNSEFKASSIDDLTFILAAVNSTGETEHHRRSDLEVVHVLYGNAATREPSYEGSDFVTSCLFCLTHIKNRRNTGSRTK